MDTFLQVVYWWYVIGAILLVTIVLFDKTNQDDLAKYQSPSLAKKLGYLSAFTVFMPFIIPVLVLMNIVRGK